MSRLILPGDRPRPSAPEIFVPRGYEDGPRRVVGKCHLCGAEFREAGQEQEWQRHLADCAKRNMDRIQAEAEKRRRSVFNEETWDPEVARALEQGAGRRMREAVDRLGVERAKREGHLEVRPNEKAGL